MPRDNNAREVKTHPVSPLDRSPPPPPISAPPTLPPLFSRVQKVSGDEKWTNLKSALFIMAMTNDLAGYDNDFENTKKTRQES